MGAGVGWGRLRGHGRDAITPIDAEVTGSGAAVVVAGRYRLGARLGSGGMGEVYRAWDPVGQRDVAVKRMPITHDRNAARVRREIRALQALALPGVVSLIDEVEEGGWQFIVMELVEGAPFPGQPEAMAWVDLAPIAESLLETLARVHAAGVIHRDLKPDNVLVNDLGRATILDFGLAKGESLGATVTKSGMFAGTPAYAAPEQLRGERPDARADLFAVGLMLFAALTGGHPNQTTNIEQLITQRVTRHLPSIGEVVPELPPHVAQTIDRMVALEAADRFDTAVEALRALRGSGDRTASHLPWLGGDALFHDVMARLDAGGCVRVGGAAGSGRSRVLHELGERLERAGRTTARLPRGERPFESLRRWSDDPPKASGGLSEAVAAWQAHVAGWMADGGVLLVDGLDSLDRYSRRVVEGVTERGAVVLAVDGEDAEVVLAPLDEAAMRELFHGPDIILHLREDGAAELTRRTRGVPAHVVSEVGAWVRAGLAAWEGERLRITRSDLDALRSGMSLSPVGVEAREVAVDLRFDQEEFLAWVALAGEHATPEVLAQVMGRDIYEIEAWVEELTDVGAVRGEMSRVVPRVPSRALQRWDAARRALAHHGLAHALPSGAPERLRHLVLSARWAERSRSAVMTGPTASFDTLDHVAVVAGTFDGRVDTVPFGDEDAGLAALEAVHIAKERTFAGRVGEAVAAIRLVLPLVRDLGRAEDVDRLLVAWTHAALVDPSPEGLRALLAAFQRSPGTQAHAARGVAQAALLAVEGVADEALDLLDSLPSLDGEPELDHQAQSVRFKAVRFKSLDVERDMLGALQAWAARRGPREMRAYHAWHGLHLYRLGAFEAAAEAQRRAYDAEVQVTSRMSVLLNEASALLEASDHAAALERAVEARELARVCRHPFFEGRAFWLVRAATYRQGEATRVRADVVEALATLGHTELIAKVAMTEAAVAWRLGDDESARTLAALSAKGFRQIGVELGALLMDALGVAAGAPAAASHLPELWERTAAFGAPRPALQALGLLAWRHPVPERVVSRAKDLWVSSRSLSRSVRFEVLTLGEVGERLGLA